MTDVYESRIDIGGMMVTLGEAEAAKESIVDAARQYGHPRMEGTTLIVRWEVGGDFIPDLWELRDVVNDLDSTLSGYGIFITPGKPDKIEEET